MLSKTPLLKQISYSLPLYSTLMEPCLISSIRPYSTVTFDANGGSWWFRSIKKKKVLSGYTVIKPSTPKNVGLTFVNWYMDKKLTVPFDFATPITADTTFYAGWIATVEFDLRGGIGNDSTNPQIVFSGDTAIKPSPPKNVGLTFVNWYMDKKLTVPFDFTTPITADTIFYAGWNITVRFDLEGGISNDGTPNIDNQFIPSGCMVTKPKTPTKEDYSWLYDRDYKYTFVNWYIDNKLTVPFDFATSITTDTTLYAGWGHTVRFDTNGGTPNVDDQFILSGHAVTKPQDPTKINRVFISWYQDSALTIPFSFDTDKITEHTTLYAGWSVIWRKVLAKTYHTVGIRTDGTLWTWGYNYYGELGLGDERNRTLPQQVGTDTWKVVGMGEYHTVGIQTDGTLWTWGYNRFGQLGLGDMNNRLYPQQVGMAVAKEVYAVPYKQLAGQLASYMGVAEGIYTVPDERIPYSGGDIDFFMREFGLGYSDNKNQSQQVVASARWSKVAAGGLHTVGIQTDGTLWVWGHNRYGQLGLGDEHNRTFPQQVGTSTWKEVGVGGYHTVGIQTDGTLWAWGHNRYGQLGLGDEQNRGLPQQVGTDTWKAVSASYRYTMGIRTDGTLWAWGHNRYGQLGLGDEHNRGLPQQVGTDTWKAVSVSYRYTMGIRTDGTLWAWGHNRYGQLGVGDKQNRIHPQQVGINTWKAVSTGARYTVAIKKDSTLWVWGNNDEGQLGLGDDKFRFTPVIFLESTNTL